MQPVFTMSWWDGRLARRAIAAAAILMLGATLGGTGASPFVTEARAIDDLHRQKAHTLIERSIEYLRAQQDPDTGGWSVQADGPQLPAITGLVLSGMLMAPDIDAGDSAVARGAEFIFSFRKPNGSIDDGILASYNTSICLSAIALLDTPDARDTINPAQDFLRSLQWSEEAIEHPEVGRVTRDHPFYGGIGYGSHSRPDNSNLNMVLQALHDSGLSCDDPAYSRAVVFLQRTQMDARINDMAYARGAGQGGFIYSTSPDGDHPGEGESKAGEIDESLPDGSNVSRLRAYGSMTYAGFKSYLYADLDRDDLRVQLAYDWIRRNYTLEENPGIGMQGYYYYLVTFSRALAAWGRPTVETISGTQDWANDLIDHLGELQKPDGSFENPQDRWMEGNTVLVTAYALLALQHAVN